ncbi:MAG: glycosyltransferase family 2 protein [Candidatus Curtissbacteria bacterium]
MKTPKISVIMSVYNGMPFLAEAVDSILGQTYKNFEFIIVDDASQDGTWKYLKSIKDKRIKLLHNPKNLGVAKSLNLALKTSTGNYAARMDSDDISLPTRFQEQAQFLEKHKEYILVGSQVQWIDEKKHLSKGFDVPQADAQIRKKLIWKNQIHHATVMFRK